MDVFVINLYNHIFLEAQNANERTLPATVSKFEGTPKSVKVVYPANSSIVEGFNISLSDGKYNCTRKNWHYFIVPTFMFFSEFVAVSSETKQQSSRDSLLDANTSNYRDTSRNECEVSINKQSEKEDENSNIK